MIRRLLTGDDNNPLAVHAVLQGAVHRYEGRDAVSKEYIPKFDFTGGTINKVVFDILDDVYVDVMKKFAAAMSRD